MGPRRRGGPHLTSEIIYERERGRRKGGGTRGHAVIARGSESMDRFLFSPRTARLGTHCAPREGELYKNY